MPLALHFHHQSGPWSVVVTSAQAQVPFLVFGRAHGAGHCSCRTLAPAHNSNSLLPRGHGSTCQAHPWPNQTPTWAREGAAADESYGAFPVAFPVTSLMLVVWPGQDLRTSGFGGSEGHPAGPVPRSAPLWEWAPSTLVSNSLHDHDSALSPWALSSPSNRK